MNTGYLIDPLTRTVSLTDASMETMRKHLPGGLTVAWEYDNGDVLYVDDEGLLRPATMAFRIRARKDGQPLMSRGVLCGPEPDPFVDATLPPGSTLAEIEAEVEWLTVDEALAWFRARAAQAAATWEDGRAAPEVLAVWDEFLRNLEGKRGYRPEDLRDKL